MHHLVALILAILCANVSGAMLNVHLVPHSHDDVGWLKTVDEYYMGANQTIQDAGVQYVIDTVLTELEANEERLFTWVEIAFFYRWWNEASEGDKQRMRSLVSKGQWEFVNGGWCQHDEAGTTDEGMIDQMTRGHQFIKENFGVVPNIAAQYDPFGHSGTSAYLDAKMGLDALFLARIDYQDYAVRVPEKTLEFVWRPSISEGSKAEIFTHVFWDTTYCYPSGFGFEWNNAPPIQGVYRSSVCYFVFLRTNLDDPRIFNVNVRERADQFSKLMKERAAALNTPEVLAMMGCDFQYQNARINYKNIDKLVKYMNAHSEEYGMTLQYSFLSKYVKAVHSHEHKWTVKTDDLFPYADQPHAYWTGYFTSRPALKGYVRTRGAILRATNKLVSSVQHLLSVPTSVFPLIDELTRAYSVSQHHDAVAGTEKQHVADDYAERLDIGTKAAQTVVGTTYSNLITRGTEQFNFCPYTNVSVCPHTEAVGQGAAVPLVLYNSLGWNRSETVFIPVKGASNFKVVDHRGREVQSAAIRRDNGTLVAVFTAYVPPVGYTTYVIEPAAGNADVQEHAVQSIRNEFYNIMFDASSGFVSTVNGKPFSLDYFWYNSSTGSGPGVLSQASGAYIFRPNKTEPMRVNTNGLVHTSVVANALFEQATLTFSDWVKCVIRLYKNKNYIEIESTVGPIPIKDKLGKEVIARFTAPYIDNQKVWYTDSNGEQMYRRKLDYRPTWHWNVTQPASGNYYPMNMAAHLSDSSTTMAIVTDRSRGCSSLAKGQLETMLHRRILHDDHRGVGEPLNETEAIRTIERVVLSADVTTISSVWRPQSLIVSNPLQVAYGPPVSPEGNGWLKTAANLQLSGVSAQLPQNVHLLTYNWEPGSSDTALVRFRHVFGVGEHPSLSLPVTISLENLFTGRKVVQVKELTLTATQELKDVKTLKWKTVLDDGAPRGQLDAEYAASPFDVKLEPLQTRTFEVKFAFN